MRVGATANNSLSVSGGIAGGSSPGGVFDIRAMDIPGARVVCCRGELDISSEEQVVAEIARSLGQPLTSIVLDLRDLTFADCTVIRCIEYAAAACDRCHVALYVDAGETVRRLVKKLGCDQLGAAEDYL